VVSIDPETKRTVALTEDASTAGNMKRWTLDLSNVASGSTLAILPVVDGKVGDAILTATFMRG
jgi:hypothetical protein